MSEASVARLELVVNKLDKSGGDAGDGPPPSVEGYAEFMKTHFQPFLDACGKIEEAKQVFAWVKTAFEFQGTVIEASVVSAKPSNEDFLKFLAPIVKVINDSGGCDSRAKSYHYEKSFAEIVQGLSWLMQPGGGKAFTKNQLDAGSFYLDKILRAAKDKPDAEKANDRAFVKLVKDMIAALGEYINEWFKSGLVWKFKGASLLSYKPGQNAAGPTSEAKLSLDERLESLAVRLERLAAKKSGGDGDQPEYLTEYETLYKETVEPFLAASAALGDIKKIEEWTKQAFGGLRTVLQAVAVSAKPSDADFMKLLDPIAKVIGGSADMKQCRKLPKNFDKAFNEAVQALNWVTAPGNGNKLVDSQLGSADFWLNKILMSAKSDPDPAKKRAFVKTLKDLLKALSEFVKEHFKMGLPWNPKGKSLAEFKAPQ